MLSFTPAVPYATTSAPLAVATADFNGDGKLDLATTVGNSSNSRVSVRLGNDAGGFGAAQEFAVPGYDTPSSIFIADFNNDTRPDMVVSEFNGFSTLIGNGDGTFQPAVYTFGVSMAYVGHFYHDSNVVGLVTWIDGDWATHVQVHWGNGQGGFVAVGQDAYYWGVGGGMAPVDLNNDGRLDVVTGEGVVFLGDGNGSLQFDWDQQAPLTGGAVAPGDFTGEGNADVIVAGNSVAVLRGRGDGSLDAPLYHSANGTTHTAVATADFNADGKLDAIVTDSDLGTASVMLGNGDGTLRFAGAFATGSSPSGVTVGDFNCDGRPDVAVSNRDSNNISVLLNDGNWAVLPPPPPPPPALSVSDATVIEGNTGTRNATFTLTLSKPAAVDVSVNYGTQNISATAGEDFNAIGGRVTIPAGQTSATFTVAVRGDRIPEPTETFAVNLNTPTNAMITDAQGIATILDDEPRISINDVSGSEGNAGNTTFTFTVQLSAAYDQTVTVNYVTANGTATAGSDYLAKSGNLAFLPGQTIKTITVTVKGDRQKEANETFFVNLSGAISTEITDSQGLATILNDDGSNSKANRNSSTLAMDAAIDDWMFFGRKKRAR